MLSQLNVGLTVTLCLNSRTKGLGTKSGRRVCSQGFDPPAQEAADVPNSGETITLCQ